MQSIVLNSCVKSLQEAGFHVIDRWYIERFLNTRESWNVIIILEQCSWGSFFSYVAGLWAVRTLINSSNPHIASKMREEKYVIKCLCIFCIHTNNNLSFCGDLKTKYSASFICSITFKDFTFWVCKFIFLPTILILVCIILILVCIMMLLWLTQK